MSKEITMKMTMYCCTSNSFYVYNTFLKTIDNNAKLTISDWWTTHEIKW